MARKSFEVPALKRQVLQGKISIHKARKITSVINKDNQNIWLERAAVQTQKQLEREVALAHPKSAVIEKSTYVSQDREIAENVKILQKIPRVQLQLGVSEKTMIQLRRAQDLESQRTKGNVSLEETLKALLKTYLHKNDPVEKAKRQKIRGKLNNNLEAQQVRELEKPQTQRVSETQQVQQLRENSDEVRLLSETGKNLESSEPSASCKTSVRCTTSLDRTSLDGASLDGKTSLGCDPETNNKVFKKETVRKAIPAKVRHQVQLRDQGQCTYRDPKGRRCRSQRYLEIHHHKEVACSGGNQIENLALLCSGHHKAHHLIGR